MSSAAIDAAPARSPARAESRRAARSLALAGLGGVLWFLGCPGFDLWLTSWVAMVPTLIAIDHAKSARRAFLLAWTTGLVGNVGGFYWVAALLVHFASLPWVLAAICVVAICAYQALTFGGFGVVVWTLRRRSTWPVCVLAPIAMVSCELLVPMVFPFNVAITQAWQLHVIQIADVTGPLGVTAVLLMVNGALFDAFAGRRLRAAAAAAIVLVATLAYGHVQLRRFDALRARAPRLRVGIVQPNVAMDAKGIDHPSAAAAQLGELQRASLRLEAQGAQLIVWPESAYPYALRRDHDRDTGAIRAGLQVPLAFGAVTRGSGGRPEVYNSLLLLDRGGRLAGRFDKRFLVPVSEHLPARDRLPFLTRLLPAGATGFTHGKEVHTLTLEAPGAGLVRLGPMICFEDTLPAFGRELAALHPHLLVNVTNDAWFGGTSEPWEHLALSVFRAVELRTELVRAVNTGVSAFVDATGRVYAHGRAVGSEAAPGADRLLEEVALLEGGRTVYARLGDLWAWCCAAVSLVSVLRRDASSKEGARPVK